MVTHPTLVSHASGETRHTGVSLMLEVLHQDLHVPQLSIQLGLVVVDQVHLPPQACHVNLKQGLHVGAAYPLALHQVQLGLQHLVLLLQETHLERGQRKQREGWGKGYPG